MIKQRCLKQYLTIMLDYSNINKVERLYGSTNTTNTININNTENIHEL